MAEHEYLKSLLCLPPESREEVVRNLILVQLMMVTGPARRRLAHQLAILLDEGEDLPLPMREDVAWAFENWRKE